MVEGIGAHQPDRVSPEGRYQFPPAFKDTYNEGVQPLLRERSPIKELLLSDRVGDMFVAPDFILQDVLASLNKPALEVGGPTSDGYEVLQDVTFPTGLVVSNLAPKSNINIRAAANALPVDDGSLSAIMASALDRVDVPKYGEGVADEVSGAAHKAILDKIASDGPDSITSSAPEAKISPRIGLIVEARRALTPGGLLILKDFDGEDITLATKLGFELKEHTRLDAGLAPREVVMQRPFDQEVQPNPKT